jgi:hypothetical protein
MSLTIESNKETTGVTTFESEACEQVQVLGAHHVPPTLATVQTDLQNLSKYFARPRLIYSSAIPTTYANMYNSRVSVSDMLTTYFPDGDIRMTGVFSIRFSLVYTIQLATTPYHQGVLVASWQYGDISTSFSPTSGDTARGAIPGMQTNLPHVRMDVSDTTMATLKVPFLSVQESLTVSSAIEYGIFTITPLLPVTSGPGTSNPTLRLYVHLEDLEFFGAVPQESASVALQSGAVAKEFMKDTHPFSSGLSSMGEVFRYVALGIPSLSSLAGPPAWFLAQAAKVARSFGFSRPITTDPPMRILGQSHVHEANIDLPSAVTMVAPTATNTLAVSTEFCHTDVDEMSLAFINGQYGQICAGVMTTANPSGTALYATRVSPSNFWFRARFSGSPPYCNVPAPASSTVNDVGNGFIPSHLFFTSACFRQWKGSFRFRFSFAKTKFHGGRVLVIYNPFPNGQANSPNPTDAYGFINGLPTGTYGPQPFGYTKMFDLRDSNVFEFDVPYVSTIPYRSFFDNIGSLLMYVQDPLISPSTVPAEVPFLVEVKALSDFELAIPVTPRYTPGVTDVGAITTIRYQSGALVSMTDVKDSQLCVGEIIKSVKQLIMIPHAILSGVVITNTVNEFNLFPWFWGPRYNISSAAPTAYLTGSFSYGHYFARAYTFLKGGTDYHFYVINPASHSMQITSYPVGMQNGVALPINLGLATNAPYSSNVRVNQLNNDYGTHLRVPAYQTVPRLETSYLLGTPWAPVFSNIARINPFPLAAAMMTNVVKALFYNISTSNSTVRTLRSAADDAALGIYVGPPILLLLPQNTTNIVYDPDSSVGN